MTFKAILLTLICLSTTLVCGQESSDLMRSANNAYLRQEYDSAAQLYQKLVVQGWESPYLLYNLGTAMAKIGDKAMARSYLEKARLLDPHDEQINRNLELVKNEIGDYYLFPPYPLFELVESVHAVFGSSFIAWSLLILYLFSLGGLIAHRYTKKEYIRWALIPCLVLLLTLFIVFLFEKAYTRFHGKMAIVLDECTLHEKPVEESTATRELVSGFKVRVHEVIGDWAAVELADGSDGWMMNESLKPLMSQKRKADE
ncbi:MAG: hypothetical protein OEQ53_11950 [Saprospiraceae bacterium]|nr:hypothetical protein [Saprospiraceae bacterium]